MSRTVTLRSVSDGGGERNLQATINEQGLIIEGHDLGQGVYEAFGANEYEWTRTVARDDLPTLEQHLGGPILDVLQSEYTGDNAAHIDRMLNDSGVPVGYWSRVGDLGVAESSRGAGSAAQRDLRLRANVRRDPFTASVVDGPGWQLFAYGLWLIGCVLFAVVAADSRDWLSFAASLLFFLGVVAVMIPLARQGRIG